jgi:hypothetical protein
VLAGAARLFEEDAVMNATSTLTGVLLYLALATLLALAWAYIPA